MGEIEFHFTSRKGDSEKLARELSQRHESSSYILLFERKVQPSDFARSREKSTTDLQQDVQKCFLSVKKEAKSEAFLPQKKRTYNPQTTKAQIL